MPDFGDDIKRAYGFGKSVMKAVANYSPYGPVPGAAAPKKRMAKAASGGGSVATMPRASRRQTTRKRYM